MSITNFKNSSKVSILDSSHLTNIGLNIIGKNKVALVLMAGGQGSRLGLDKPKGTLQLNGVSLFERHAKQISELNNKTGGNLVWYIMTSDKTHEDTIEYFKEMGYFGLLSDDIIFFRQGNNYCVYEDGRRIIENMVDGQPVYAKNPNGSGGIYKAIRDNGLLDDMEKRGIEHLYIYNVDNPLVKIADPLFLGYCRDLDCGVKVVCKKDPEESVGVFCYKDNKPGLMEYFELLDEYRYAKDENGELLYRQGNIGIYYLSFSFVKNICELDDLEHHMAHKKIAYYDDKLDKTVKPLENNGYKPELFIFDAFPKCDISKMKLLEIEREDEFFPIKRPNDINNYLSKYN